MRTLVGALIALALAQQSQAPTGSISGRVIDAGSGAPIADATVSYSLDGNRTRVSVQSDSSGRFVLSNVPGGHLFLSATKNGYAVGHAGSNPYFDLSASEQVTAVDLRMRQHASLSGRVTDQSGLSVAGAEITAHRLEIVAGRFDAGIGKKVRTDREGRYLIEGLLPASYIVSATFLAGSPGVAGRVGGSGAQQTTLDYPRVFYPGGFVAADASILEFASGESKTNVDLTQRELRTTRVSGRVEGAPVNGLVVELTRESNAAGIRDSLSAMKTTTTADGSFTFPRVPAGRYRATSLHVPRRKFDAGQRDMMQTLGANGLTIMDGSSQESVPLAAVPTAPHCGLSSQLTSQTSQSITWH